MELGKLSNEKLKTLVLNKLKHKCEDVVIRPGVGEDCCAIKIGGELCVLSTDPITACSADAGTLAVHVTANDIASSGVKPIAMLVTMLVPPSASEADVERVADQITAAADLLEIEIVGGHTEVTDAVNRIVISTTALGKSDKMVSTAGALLGDDIILTKSAGIEGTGIILADYADRVQLSEDEKNEIAVLAQGISVVKEGIVAAYAGANSMHDVTEGGVLGAVYEMCEASGMGAVITEANIPIAPVTRKICAQLNINPLRLISSGSMLITGNAEVLLPALKKAGVQAAVIGQITKENVLLHTENGTIEIEPPGADELYKIL